MSATPSTPPPVVVDAMTMLRLVRELEDIRRRMTARASKPPPAPRASERPPSDTPR